MKPAEPGLELRALLGRAAGRLPGSGVVARFLPVYYSLKCGLSPTCVCGLGGMAGRAVDEGSRPQACTC